MKEEKLKTTPCVGCGYCCVKTICAVGYRVGYFMGEGRVCKGLIWDEHENRHFCRLGQMPGTMGKMYREEMFMGAGCSSALFNNWRTELKDRTKMIIDDGQIKNPLSSEFQIFIKALGNEPFLSGDVITMVLISFKNELLKTGRYDDYTAQAYVGGIFKQLREHRSTKFDGFAVGLPKELPNHRPSDSC
ncbi:hypothetical protein KAR91_88145 [Candidatus Pacearchaeota archaeon]|nr:hypothetical protein [Candidatus Pacearchaeota archaeon]